MQPFHRPPAPHFPSTTPDVPPSPVYEKESHIDPTPVHSTKPIVSTDIVKDYEDKRDSLSNAIDSSKHLLADLRNLNRDQWPVRYPHISSGLAANNNNNNNAPEGHQRTPTRPGLKRRTLTFADEPTVSTEILVNKASTPRNNLKRSLTVYAPSTADQQEGTTTADDERPEDLSILRLDLNLGVARQATTLISHLEKSSISALIDNRIASSLDHLNLLQKRIHDPQSRVLVTGDLNAGKSTLINALLRRPEVMPTDQQPLTARFVEVVKSEEQDVVHVPKREVDYDIGDESTYSVEELGKLSELVTAEDDDAVNSVARVYLKNAVAAKPSILYNDVVDISLIDAPGLNRDSIITTANFARQEEIDVIIFVVSAANHFTLSAKEFIWQAGHEKAHLFIVVNRFDQIKDKERCRRLVLDQVKQLSPSTFENAANLVHFVDSAKVALHLDDEVDAAFSHLEQSLRSFVLINRKQSKLGPANNYLTHLLADVELLASANALLANHEHDRAKEEQKRVRPVLDRMRQGQDSFEDSLVAEEEAAAAASSLQTRKMLDEALERVGQGQLAVSAPGLSMPLYPGVLGVWDYARAVREVLLLSLDSAVSLAETEARLATTDGVRLVGELGDKYLPVETPRSTRKFNPNAMFSTRSNNRRRSVTNIGLGLAAQTHLVESRLSDLFDLQHHMSLAQGVQPSRDLIPFVGHEASNIGVASLAVGAVSMVGLKPLAIRSFLEGIIRVAEFASNPAARKTLASIAGAVLVGAVAYGIYELPRSVPRNVGRSIQNTLSRSSGSTDIDDGPFSEAQAARISREVRKVLRLASWDLRERFRSAVDVHATIIRDTEESERRANLATEFFQQVEKQIDVIREQIRSVKF